MIRMVTTFMAMLAISGLAGVIAPAAADDFNSVRTESGRVRCLIYADYEPRGGGPLVVCQTHGEDNTGFAEAPASSTPGFRLNMAIVRATGEFSWDVGNIPGDRDTIANDLVLSYGQTYNLKGWIVEPSSSGTRFTYTDTGHGMFVSVENVDPF